MLWKSIKFWLWLEIDFPNTDDEGDFEVAPGDCGPIPDSTTQCFELLSFTSEFELNAIPTANVSIPLGRRGDNVNIISNIHYFLDNLQLQLPTRVYCRADTPTSVDPAETEHLWPEGKFLIFDGYVTGSGFRRSNGGAEFVLGLTHWLTDLNFSSALSKQSHPLNPSQLYYEANFTLDATLVGGNFINDPGTTQVGNHLALPFFDTSIISVDFWGGLSDVVGPQHTIGGLKDWLLYLTKLDRVNANQITNRANLVTSVIKPELNWEGCRAIKRFEPNAVGPLFSDVGIGYKFGVPLSLVDEGALNTHIATSIGDEIGFESFTAYENVTLWDKLSGQFHANYMFSVVPLIERAICVPFVPGLSGTGDSLVHRTIRTTQYESIDLSAVMPRPLRAVGVIIGRSNEAGGGVSLNDHVNHNSFGGWFDKVTESTDPRYKEGLILFKEGPKWATRFVNYHAYTPDSTGVSATIRTPVSPVSGITTADLTPATILEAAPDIWDLYARVLYIHETLKGRQGTITGPVRFDIAPGSSIKVEVSEDKFVKDIVQTDPNINICDNAYYQFFYCAVMRVSTTIDSQNNRAMTSYYVGHVRSETENTDPGTSIPYHPIWQQYRWAGCALIDDPAFVPLRTYGVES